VSFVEPLFYIFFFVVFIVYWITPNLRFRKVWLLLSSYVFYSAWDWRFLSLILLSTVVDFVAGLALAKDQVRGGRKLWLIVSLCVNLGVLGIFKYYNFFLETVNVGASFFGAYISPLNVVLPVGISFYTFQTMSYTIDVYRRELKAVRNFTDFALFVGFFPQLVAGPIVRASTFLPQLETRKYFDQIPFKSLFTLFLIGFIKKSCVSDNLAVLIDPVFGAPGAYDAVSIWISTVFYAAQIYCDFSGYTDMAIAAAGLLGYELTLNFNFPYFAKNIADFWRRWHISLSTWLRDYLYISLGGNRHGAQKTLRNLMLTMLLGGLWHGAAWNFVIWGGLHGLALIAHRKFREKFPEGSGGSTSFFGAIAPLLTFYWVCLAWIFFRSPDLTRAMTMVGAFVAFLSPGETSIGWKYGLWIIPMALAHWIAMKGKITEQVNRIPDPVFSAGLGVAVVIALMFVRVEYRPFIYFQF
jgi:alginate O-acetyltransferase complex protein AlgI